MDCQLPVISCQLRVSNGSDLQIVVLENLRKYVIV